MNRFDPSPSVAPAQSLVISAIDELNEVNQDDGWSAIEYRQLEPGPLTARFSSRESPRCLHASEVFDRRLEIHCALPSGMMAVFSIEGGAVKANGESVGSRELFVLGPGAEVHGGVPAGVRVNTLLAPVTAFEEAHRRLLGGNAPFGRGRATVVRARSQSLRSLRLEHRRFLTAACDRGIADEELSADILAGVVRALSTEGPAPALRPSRRRALRALARAREYIEAHLGEPVTIPAVCDYAGVGVRTLERYFVRELGVSPKHYLTARRVNAARKVLLAAHPKQVSVTDVALDHGMTHLGRFPAVYRSYFGEEPRGTLRNAPSS